MSVIVGDDTRPTVADIMPRPACDKCNNCCTYDCNDPLDHCLSCPTRAWIMVRDERNDILDYYDLPESICVYHDYYIPPNPADICANGCRCD